MSPRPPPKISLKHDWKRELGSEDAHRPEGQVVQQFKSFQSNQPIPNPDHYGTGQPVARTERTGQPVVGTNTRTVQYGRKTSRSQEIDTRQEQFLLGRELGLMLNQGNILSPIMKYRRN